MADRDDTHTLVVPVNVDALVVNEPVRAQGGQGFRRWQPNFNLLRHNLSPEPEPFTGEHNLDADGDGVHVRWELPEALRRGAGRTPGGRTEFPLVPNRWLVVRYVKDQPQYLAAWVVESDFLDDREGTSPSVHPVRRGADPAAGPYRATLITTRIGRATPLAEWHEPSGDPARKELFLTAVGPGIMTFHVYQPYHENVFSLHDRLDGIDRASVDYQVVGWYSDPAQEELNRLLGAEGATVESVLAGLGWTVDSRPQDWKPGSTTYCGRVASVAWDRKATTSPDSDRPQKDKIKIAVGSSADEAHAALVAAARAALPAASGNGIGHSDPALLHALGRGLADTLDGTDGSVRTAQALHKGWFEQVPGGYVWRLADTSGKGNASGDPKSVTWSGVAPEQEQWLARLNNDQDAYDTAARELTVLQQRLYGLWWMHGLPLIPPQYRREQFRAEIDPGNPDGLAAEVARRQKELEGLRAKVPYGADGPELDRSIAAYLREHPLPTGYELRREALPPFWQVTDPTVVLSGANDHTPHTSLTGKEPLVCRMPGQITGGVEPGGKLPAALSGLAVGELPPVVAAVLGEFVHLLGEGGLPAWRQPWKPLLYQWQVDHWQVPYGDLGRPNWEFDGSRYEWRRGGAVQNALQVTGRRFLVPLPQYTLGSGLDRHAADHPTAVPETFAAASDQVKDLDLLSQRLDGLTASFACRDTAPNLSPPGEMGKLVGDAFRHLPDPGELPEPFKGWNPSGFTQIRAGQFAVKALSIVDEFGQTLDVVLQGDAGYMEPVVADSLHPGDRHVEGTLAERFVQLPPRLLQPARLRFDFVDEREADKPVDLEANTTPVCAWIIPNYVDRSLLCYAPDGTPLGELLLKLQEDPSSGQITTVVGWDPLPDSRVRTLEDLRTARPQLYAFATRLVAGGTATFADLMSTVDRALAGIDPGSPYGDEVLGALLGRPLALVRARLGFELDGPPVTDPGWRYALDWRALTEWRDRTGGDKPVPEEMAHLAYQWPIRLGNAGQKGDGLIGYFSEDDYTKFYAVATPETAQPTGYVEKIAPTNWPRLAADSTHHTHLTLLLDPQASVHATTDVLPVTDLRLPERFTRTAMAAMKVALRLSPVLTTARKVPTQPSGFVNALALPHPTSPQGTWDWAELVVPDTAAAGADPAPEWAHQPIVQIDQKARLDEDGPVVRTGFLRLSDGFGDK